MPTLSKIQQNTIAVLTRMVEMVSTDENYAEIFSKQLDAMLNEINNQDGFGTEGQCDPRGDFRSGNWSMKRIQNNIYYSK